MNVRFDFIVKQCWFGRVEGGKSIRKLVFQHYVKNCSSENGHLPKAISRLLVHLKEKRCCHEKIIRFVHENYCACVVRENQAKRCLLFYARNLRVVHSSPFGLHP